MAPLLAACRLHVPRNLVVLVLILYFLIQSSSSIIVYDHQMLVNLQNLTKDWTATALQSPVLSLLHLFCWTYRRKARCTAIKCKLFWKDARLRQPCLRQLTRGHSHAGPVCLAKMLCYPTTFITMYILSKSHSRGVHFYNLWINEVLSTYLALINARSLANKTFIINDCFVSHEFNILCVTETWLNEGNKYFSNVIVKSQYKPAVLFATVNNVLNPPYQIRTEISLDLCETFLDIFVTKIANLSGTTSPLACTFIEPQICRATWSGFKPITFFHSTKL